MDTSEEILLCFNHLCAEKGLKICTRCRVAQYCSKECQVQHWKRHKKFCKMISSSPEMYLRHDIAVNSYNTTVDQSNSAEFDQSLLSFQELLKIFEEFEDELYTSLCYYGIGNILNSKKQHEEALVNYRKALEICREIHGENHFQTCDCYEAIGNVLSDQGRYEDAFIGYGKALAIRKKMFGENHIDIGQTYYNIGLVQLKKGDNDGALISFRKSNAIFTSELGEDHWRTVQTNVNIDFCQKRIDQSNIA